MAARMPTMITKHVEISKHEEFSHLYSLVKLQIRVHLMKWRAFSQRNGASRMLAGLTLTDGGLIEVLATSQ